MPNIQQLSGKNASGLLFIGLFCLIGIIYGSLMPFNFESGPSLYEAWNYFIDFSHLNLGNRHKLDWSINLIMCIPAAFFLCGWWNVRRSNVLSAQGLVIALSLCGMVSIGVEFTQHYLPLRTSSLNDLLAQFIGILLGIFFWYLFGRRFYTTWQSIYAGGKSAIQAALLFYLLVYLIICLFPYDFIVSLSELRAKLDGDGVGIWLAGIGCDSGLRCLVKQLVEVLVTMPLGVLFAWLWGIDRPTTLYRVLLTGFIIGCSIELIQLFEASGISQGISVLTRTLGMGLGCWLLRHLKRHSPGISPAAIRLSLVLLLPLYLLLLTRLNGWSSQSWLSWREARQQLASLNWLPFYYHFFTPETNAMASLDWVACSYAPLGLGVWLWRNRPNHANHLFMVALLAGGCALLIETGKLFLSLRPDPTNIMIGILSATLAYSVVVWIRRSSQKAPPVTLNATINAAARSLTSLGAGVYPAGAPRTGLPTSNAIRITATGQPQAEAASKAMSVRPAVSGNQTDAASATQVPLLQGVFVLLMLASLIYAIAYYPLQPTWLAASLILYAVLLWYYPDAWLIVIPALLPVLDLTMWSGRFFFNEFDIVILLTITLGWGRHPLTIGRSVLISGAVLIISLVILIQLFSTLIGLLPLAPLDANAFSNYYSPYNSLRQSKGFWWALLLLPLLRSARQRGAPLTHLFTIGVLTGLSATGIVILWERITFTGLFNFDHDYRITALFSGMHTGDAFVDGYLITAFPFIMACFLEWRGYLRKLLGVGLFALTLYGILVTFSRMNYLALGIIGLVLGAGTFMMINRLRPYRTLFTVVLLILVAAAVILPVLRGSYIQQRFATTATSWEERLDHWGMTLRMRDHDWMTTLFGMGQGSFPRTYFWKNEKGIVPATYQYLTEDNNRFLQLGSGDSLYMRQHIRASVGIPYVLSIDLRSNRQNSSLTIPICEKFLLDSFHCDWFGITITAPAGQWKHYQITARLSSPEMVSRFALTRRPLTLALYNGQPDNLLDIDNLQLKAPDGFQLIKNGDFSAGQDYWLFTTDNHLPWHSKNLGVQILFEAGWVGLTIFSILLAVVFISLYRRCSSTDPVTALVLMASLSGFLAVGLFSSLFDEPRMTLLFFLLVWLALLDAPAAADSHSQRWRWVANRRRFDQP